MTNPREPLLDVARLWTRYQHAEFPAHLRGVELAGVDLSTLDTDVAGCVSTWSSNGGRLEPERVEVLRWCVSDLRRVLPLLADPAEIKYFRRLLDLGQLVVDAPA